MPPLIPLFVTTSYGIPSGVLLLLFFLAMLPSVSAVCTVCYGHADGCTGDSTACPWVTGVAANVAMVSAAAGGILKIQKLLPAKFVRLFPRSALEAFSSLLNKVKTSGTPFDPSGKTVKEITIAVKGGQFSKNEAILFLNDLLQDAEEEIAIKKLDSTIKTLEHIDTSSVGDNGAMEGGFLYILFKESQVFCKNVMGSTSFDFCGPCEVETKPSSKTYSATLIRPSTVHGMYSLLNGFTLTCHAFGLCNVLAMGPFLEDVVYEPIRTNTIPWMVAFESLILYLRLVENGSGAYNITDVVRKFGGIDALRAQALVSAHEHFPAAFFRTVGGNPNSKGTGTSDTSGGEHYTGTIKGSRPGASKPCISWNLGKPHLAKNVDANGLCNFLHKCDMYVSDKGPDGRCLGNHKRADCDYDPAKRVKQPAK